MKNDIIKNEKNKANLDQAIREGGTEGLAPTITKADEDRAKAEKKEEKESKKFSKDHTKKQMTEAKKKDEDMKKEFKNQAAKESLKVFGKKSSLAQKA